MKTLLIDEKKKHIFKLLYNEGLICDETHGIYMYIDDITLIMNRENEPTGYCKYKKRNHLVSELEKAKFMVVKYIKQSASDLSDEEFNNLLQENIKNNTYGNYPKTSYAAICTIIKKLRHHEVKVIDVAWGYSIIGFVCEKYK
jgi:hypothetical protein